MAAHCKSFPPPPDPLFVYHLPNGAEVTSLAVLDHLHVAIGSETGQLLILSLDTFRPIVSWLIDEGPQPASIVKITNLKSSFSPTDHVSTVPANLTIAVQTRNNRVSIWNLTIGKENPPQKALRLEFNVESLGFCAAAILGTDDVSSNPQLTVAAASPGQPESLDIFRVSQDGSIHSIASNAAPTNLSPGMLMHVAFGTHSTSSDNNLDILAAYETGMLVKYSLNTLSQQMLEVECINLHHEPIIGMDVHASSSFAVSCSADQFIHLTSYGTNSGLEEQGKMSIQRTQTTQHIGNNLVRK